MPHLLTKAILAETIGKKRLTNIQDIFRYVQKTGHTELYINPNMYFWLAATCRGFGPVPEDCTPFIVDDLKEGRTEEDLPYYEILGIRFIMLCGEKLDAVHLLRQG